MERQRGLHWEAELASVPPGALKHAAGMEPPPGFKMALVLSDQAAEQNGVYWVPAIELLPSQEREQAKRSQERAAAHGHLWCPPRQRRPGKVPHCLLREAAAAAADQIANTVEEQVNYRLGQLLHGAEFMPKTAEGASLSQLSRIYRVISGEKKDWVDLPADVDAELFGKPQDCPWVIKHESGRDPGCGRAALNGRARLGGGVTACLADVRAAVDAVARRLLRSDLPREAPTPSLFDPATLGSGIAWPPLNPSGDWPVDQVAIACDRARLFLSSLDYLSVADTRQASELRHRLRTAGLGVLHEAVLFLGGVHPARQGQEALVQDLLRLVALPERSPELAKAAGDDKADGGAPDPAPNRDMKKG